MTLPWGNHFGKRKAWLLTGIIEVECKWPQSLCTATNLFLVFSMIWTWYRLQVASKSQKRNGSNDFVRNRIIIIILSRWPIDQSKCQVAKLKRYHARDLNRCIPDCRSLRFFWDKIIHLKRKTQYFFFLNVECIWTDSKDINF